MILLRSKHLVITKVLRKTKAKLFCDLVVGSHLLLSIEVRKAGTNRGSTYSSYISVRDCGTGEVSDKSFNELPKLLDCFEIKEEL